MNKISVVFCVIFYIVSTSNAIDITGKVRINFYTTSLSSPTVYPIETGYKVLQNADYDPNKKTVIFVHGYLEDMSWDSQQAIATAYMKRSDYNTILLDWGDINKSLYFHVASKVPFVGKKLAVLLQQMYARRLVLKNLRLVGHSMGAHIVAIAGRNVKSSFIVPSIIGLDPAFPGFYFPPLTAHTIQSGDGDFVMCLATDSGLIGTPVRDCDVNFVANFGTRIQPGCPLISFPFTHGDICSHQRSDFLWASAVDNQTIFVAKYCKYYPICDKTKTAIMEPETPITTKKGIYYFKTGSTYPFGLG